MPSLLPFSGQNIVGSGLVFFLDAGNTSSYPGSGTTWNDLSGNSINGSMQGTVSFASNYFTNFSSSYFLTSNCYGPIPTGSSNRTMIAGFRTPSTIVTASTYAHIAHYGTNTTYQAFGLTLWGISPSQYLACHTWSSNAYRTNSALSTSTDYIGAVVFNNSVSPRQTFYLNGVLGSTGYSQGMTGDYAINTGTTYQINVGARASTLEYWNDGRIYFVQMYNRALTSDEILQNFNATRGRLNL